jgi:cytochrome c-type biogenesis protein
MSFIPKHGYTFPVFYDLTLEATISYGVSAFPTTYFIDANGDPLGYVTGPLDTENLLEIIEMIR